jgi:alcohol dehydrogenase (cytochrome c)
MARNFRRLLPSAVMSVAAGIGAGSMTLAQNSAKADTTAKVVAPSPSYAQHCATCHGAKLTDGQFAPALKGPAFLAKWGGATAEELDQYIRRSMPPANAGRLDPATYSAILTDILDSNGGQDAGRARSADADLSTITLPMPPSGVVASPVGGLSTRHPIPAWPVPRDPFANYAPVTEAELANPAPEDWPAWRRSHLGQGYSPLNQITTANVGQLRLAWSQALPPGEATTEPLVHRGVLYMFGYGDQIFAFDAATGRQLWRYQRTLPAGVNASGKKTIALYGDKLYAATSDLHMIALDARTGRPVWDRAVTNKSGLRSVGGPLVAKGVVMLGLTGQAPGGALIAALDAETGEKLWSFNTVAQPGTPGGDTWNGLTAEERSGGSVWTSGSFDPVTGLALWGTAQTYDTGPMRDRKPGMNNDGLYTNTTLAFEPRSGKLVWHYQHMKNDQFDLDWVFDRVIGTIDVGGKPRRVVMTSGKEGLFDAIDAATGKYLRTVDMGIQNFVTKIDPKTGEKFVDPDLIPDRSRVRYLCPHGGGGRNWSPTAFEQSSATIFVNARDVCTDIIPVEGRGFLSTGVNMEYAPPPNSDGKYGMIRALDMATGTIRWTAKQRTPYSMGMLATAGGLLFSGSVDRQITAYDQNSGKTLWSQQLSGIPNASAITYAVNGKQYVAMITGYGNPLSLGIGVLTPELQMPPVTSSGVYVFALPD